MLKIKKISTAVLCAGILTSGSASASDYTLRFAHVLTENTPNAQAAVKFKEVVESESGGKISVEIFPAAQLGGDVEIIEQIQMGLIDVGFPPTATLGNFEPKMQIIDLPFLITDYEDVENVLDGEVGREILDLLDSHGMYGVNFWGAGFRHMTNNVRPIETPEDLKGIRMRTMQSPILLSTYNNFDANPTAMAFTEVYNGLQQGVIDGQENSFANIYSMRFHEVQDYLSLTSHAYHAYAAVINKNTWESLPPELQSVVEKGFEEGKEAARNLTIEYDKNTIEEIANDIEITEISDEQKEKFIVESMPVHEEYTDVVSKELLGKVYKAVGIE